MCRIFFIILFFCFLSFVDVRAEAPIFPPPLSGYCEIFIGKSIIKDGESTFQGTRCLGFLISQHVMVTAAHCLDSEGSPSEKIHVACYNSPKGISEVRIASFPLDKNDDSISKKFPPQFIPDINDIAALYFKEPMDTAIDPMEILPNGIFKKDLQDIKDQCFLVQASQPDIFKNIFFSEKRSFNYASIKPLKFDGFIFSRLNYDTTINHYTINHSYFSDSNVPLNWEAAKTTHDGRFLLFSAKDEEENSINLFGSSGSGLLCKINDHWKVVGVASGWVNLTKENDSNRKRSILFEFIDFNEFINYSNIFILRGVKGVY